MALGLEVPEGVARLTDLAPGAPARVVSIQGKIRLISRLFDLGMVPGTRVEVVRSAPMNGALEVRVRGTSLAISPEMACGVMVLPE